MIILSNITKSQSPDFLGMAFQLILLIIVFIFVIFLAYYSTKFIAGFKIKNMTKNNMKILETISIGYNNIHIIQVNKQYFLISSSKEGVRMLSEIDGTDLVFTQNNFNNLSFDKHFKQHLKKSQKEEKQGGKYEK